MYIFFSTSPLKKFPKIVKFSTALKKCNALNHFVFLIRLLIRLLNSNKIASCPTLQFTFAFVE